MIGLNISLRFIFKPSYSPHCINRNVVCYFSKNDLHYDRIRTD